MKPANIGPLAQKPANNGPIFYPFSHGFVILDDAARRGGVRVITVVVENIYTAARVACVGPIARRPDPATPTFVQLDRLASRATLARKIRSAIQHKNQLAA